MSQLSCPSWIRFECQSTGKAYFYNIETHQVSLTDPDEEIQAWRSIPARVQQTRAPDKPQYVEGSEDFNVWYGKYEKDRSSRKERERAGFRCDPQQDSGWTEADKLGAAASAFCIFFARGECNHGHRCTYYHHIPTADDLLLHDEAHDIFGRERHSSHRDDMGGVGSFNSDGRSLFIGDLRFDRAAKDAVKQVETELWNQFGIWGTLVEVKVLPAKAIAFVRYASRGSAEFAKEAMANQRLGLAECISVRWAREDPSLQSSKRRCIEHQHLVTDAAMRKQQAEQRHS